MMSEYVKPNHRTILLEPDHTVCDATDKLRLLVVVYSAPNHEDRRKVIRKTWGKAFLTYPGVKMIFLVGQQQSKGRLVLNQDIVKEAEEHNDLVQEDFIDTFVNLTVKATFMFKWITSNDCLTAKFLFKVDDDTFVNPEQLWASLEHSLLHSATTKSLLPFFKKNQMTQNKESVITTAPLSESIDYLVMGRVMKTVPDRDSSHKHYLPSKFYPLNIFPQHLSGSGYVLSMSIVPLLYECMLRTPFMNLEDVMLTGLCATTQMGLKLTDNPMYRAKKPTIGPEYVCFYKKSAFVHGLNSLDMEAMWLRISEDHNCDTFYFNLVESLTSFMEIWKTIFRLDA